jgi:galactokinase
VTLAAPARQATSLFQQRFGSRPLILVSAPGRVNLLGEHIDYNGGPVLPLAIERRTVIAAGYSERWELVSALDGELVVLDPDKPPKGHWSAYVAGVIQVLKRLGMGMRGARLAIVSTVPVGTGLSSSAALAVAVTRALTGLAGIRTQPEELADYAWQAEHDEVGVKCGRMDQTIAALAQPGKAMLFETSTGAVTHTPFTEKLWVIETGVTRKLAEAGYNARRQECEQALRLVREAGDVVETLAAIPSGELPRLTRMLPPPFNARLRHVVTETERTRAGVVALAARDLTTFGRLMVESHGSMRDDFQASCAEADLLVDRLMHHGARGARITGAGWGGAVIALLPPEKEARILAEVQEDFRQQYARLPEAWTTHAGAGVRSER